MSWPERPSVSWVAVEYGCCSLRAVQIHRAAGRIRIAHWVSLEAEIASPDPVSPHSPRDLAAAFGPGTFTGSRLALNLSPPDVEYQLLEVPAVVLQHPPDQLRTALEIELDRQMPWPIAESEIAIWPVRAGGTGKTPAMVVAARRSVLETRLKDLADRKLFCRRADILPNGLIHLFGEDGSSSAADQPPDIWGILDLGFLSSRLYLIQGDRPVYARILRQGGRELTTAIASALHIDFAIAEAYKRVFGMKATERGYRSVLGGLSRISEAEMPGVLYAVLRPVLENLAHEIERSFRFVLGQFPGSRARNLYLVGGGARLHGLVDLLASQLGVPTALPDPAVLTRRFPSWGEQANHPALGPETFCVLAACIGLALAEESP